MSFNSLFKQIEDDLRRHNPRLKKNLDDLCEASYQRDFNFISVARAFNMLGRFAKNDHKGLQAIKAHRFFVPRMMQVAQQQMQDNLCNTRGFANLLYGCMKLSITPDEAWQTIFWKRSQEQLGSFNPQEFSNTLYAAAKLSLEPSKDWQKAFWTQSQRKLSGFEPQHFSNTLYAAAKLSLKAHIDWQKAFWTQSQRKLSGFEPQHFSNTLHAAANLSLTPPEDWQKAFWTQSQHQLSWFNPQAYSNTLHAAAQLSLKPPKKWKQAFWKQSQSQISRFNPHEMINMLYAACVLDLKIPKTVKPLVQSTVTSKTEADIRHLQAMYSAKDYLEAQGIKLVFKENTPEKLRQSENTRVSQLEEKTGIALVKVLQDKWPQIPLKEHHFIRPTASTADFFIDTCACGDQGLVIQVDGPSHFLDKGTERQCVNGFTAFQTRRLKKAGYQVLRLPYDLLNTHGVYDIEDENSTVPKALAGYLEQQLNPYILATT